MALSLIEGAKVNSGDVYRQAVIAQFAQSSPLLDALVFENIVGNAYKYNQEGTLPGVGFRGVNEAFSESTGILNPITEALVIAGGDLDVDKFIVDTNGQSARTTHEAMKIKALALAVTAKLIKGDQSTSPAELDGLQRRIGGSQLIAAGNTSGGDALSLAKMEQVIDQCEGCTHLVMNRAMIRRLTQAARTTSIGGYISFAPNQFGQRVMSFNDKPIIPVDYDNTGAQILPFTEANPGGGTAASTSIYALKIAADGVLGLQNGNGMSVRDMGEQQVKPVFRTRVEWYMGLALLHGRCASRLNGIKDAAIVA